MDEQAKTHTIKLSSTTSFVFGLIIGFLVLSTIGFFVLLGFYLKGEKTEIKTNDKTQAEASQQQDEEDWTVFENNLPDDIRQIIANNPNNIEPTSLKSNDRVKYYNKYSQVKDTLIVFYHPGCGWCKRFYPVLLQAKEKYPNLKIYAVIFGDYNDLVTKFNFSGTPSFIVNGQYAVGGYMPEADLFSLLDEVLK